MTYAEVVAEIAKIDAAIERITGTSTSGGAQEYGQGSTRVVRADLKALYDRKQMLETMKARLATSDGGVVRYPIFGTRS